MSTPVVLYILLCSIALNVLIAYLNMRNILLIVVTNGIGSPAPPPPPLPRPPRIPPVTQPANLDAARADISTAQYKLGIDAKMVVISQRGTCSVGLDLVMTRHGLVDRKALRPPPTLEPRPALDMEPCMDISADYQLRLDTMPTITRTEVYNKDGSLVIRCDYSTGNSTTDSVWRGEYGIPDAGLATANGRDVEGFATSACFHMFAVRRRLVNSSPALQELQRVWDKVLSVRDSNIRGTLFASSSKLPHAPVVAKIHDIYDSRAVKITGGSGCRLYFPLPDKFYGEADNNEEKQIREEALAWSSLDTCIDLVTLEKLPRSAGQTPRRFEGNTHLDWERQNTKTTVELTCRITKFFVMSRLVGILKFTVGNPVYPPNITSTLIGEGGDPMFKRESGCIRIASFLKTVETILNLEELF